MTENILLSVLLVFSIFIPLVTWYLSNLIDLIDKSTIKSPVSYLNRSTLRALFKNAFYKTEVNATVLVSLFFLIVLCLSLANFVWAEYLLILKLKIQVYFLLLFLIKVLLYNFYFYQAKRVNKTDMIIHLSNYLIFFLLSFSIFYQGLNSKILTMVVFGVFALINVDNFLIVRIEKLIATKSFYIKYIFELLRYTHTLCYLNVLMKSIPIVDSNWQILWLIILPVMVNFFIKLFYDRSINNKNLGENKKQDRLIVCVFIFIIMVGEAFR